MKHRGKVAVRASTIILSLFLCSIFFEHGPRDARIWLVRGVRRHLCDFPVARSNLIHSCVVLQTRGRKNLGWCEELDDDWVPRKSNGGKDKKSSDSQSVRRADEGRDKKRAKKSSEDPALKVFL